jgi:hypothetical protein
MTTKDTIHRDLTTVAEMIVNARAALSRNEIVDIAEIPVKVREVMGSITDLPPEDAVELRPMLVELLTDFKDFATDVNAKIADIESDGGASAAGRSGA